MTEIAPWDRGSLPARLATIQREIEGKTRRFALWRWDERLVWCDLLCLEMWWASSDRVDGNIVKSWDDVVQANRFGRAFSSNFGYFGLETKLHQLPLSCHLSFSSDFHFIVNHDNGGIAKEKQSADWINFAPLDDAYARRKRGRLPSLWHYSRDFYGYMPAFLRAYTPRLLDQFPRGVRTMLKMGAQAPELKLLRDLALLSVYENILFMDFLRIHSRLCQKIINHFGLPTESRCHVFSNRNDSGLRLFLQSQIGEKHLQICLPFPTSSSAHERLELQLRLRDALRPMLTSTEIETLLASTSELR